MTYEDSSRQVPSTRPAGYDTPTDSPDPTFVSRSGVVRGRIETYFEDKNPHFPVSRATRAEAIRIASQRPASVIVEAMRAANAEWVQASLDAAPLNFSGGPDPEGGSVPYQAAPVIPAQKQHVVDLMRNQAELFGAALEVRLDQDQNPSAF